MKFNDPYKTYLEQTKSQLFQKRKDIETKRNRNKNYGSNLSYLDDINLINTDQDLANIEQEIFNYDYLY